MEPIFNKKITKKYNSWDHKQYIYVLFTVDKVNYYGLVKKKKKNVKKNVDVQTKWSLYYQIIKSFTCKKIYMCNIYLYILIKKNILVLLLINKMY